ncbi:MAG: Zn-ribbon domain-containing OB-fold protein [Chloroflexi bacterium]|nr:Zn-ribbon domain-containing OB-fold protein [Chloroflexota bacterium]
MVQAKPKKPLPLIEPETQAFWEAAKRHEFTLQKCQNCGAYYFPATDCNKCSSPKMEWVQASGKGKVFTFITMHQLYHPSFEGEIPYNVSIIELAEGPFMMSNVVDIPADDVKIGMPVEVVFEDVNDEVAMPRFKPAK